MHGQRQLRLRRLLGLLPLRPAGLLLADVSDASLMTAGRPPRGFDRSEHVGDRRRTDLELPDFILHLLPLEACILNLVSCGAQPPGRQVGPID
jgi:hypothetical protein